MRHFGDFQTLCHLRIQNGREKYIYSLGENRATENFHWESHGDCWKKLKGSLKLNKEAFMVDVVTGFLLAAEVGG